MKNITTRDEIIKTAKKLFLDNGFNNVAMRDIAAKLEISVGNLTYYFKKKEDLAEEVVSGLFDEYKPLTPCKTLNELNEWIIFSEKIGEKNAFYFKNYTLFSGLSKKISAIQLRVFEDNIHFWEMTFSNLATAKLFKPESFAGQYLSVARTMHFMKIYWQDTLEAERNMGVKLSGFHETVWGILFPLLTPKGEKIYLNEMFGK